MNDRALPRERRPRRPRIVEGEVEGAVLLKYDRRPVEPERSRFPFRRRRPWSSRVAINEFGRIGRSDAAGHRQSGRTDIEVVGINDLGGRDQRPSRALRQRHGRFTT